MSGLGHMPEAEARRLAAQKPPRRRTCNRHHDCDAADAEAHARTRGARAAHCWDDCCDECFGN